MKRIVALLLVVLMVFSLAACGEKKGVCDLCGETKTVKTVTVAGEKATLCKDCEQLVKIGSNILGL